MSRQRVLVLLVLVATAAGFVALAALAAGATRLFGTAAAGEREVFAGAATVAVLAAVALLVLRRSSGDAGLGPVGGAAVGLLIALALSPPAVLAFSTSVSTPADDSSGCGTISTPVTVFDQVQRETVVTPTCTSRLRRQKLLAAALVAPSVVIAGHAVSVGLRASRPDTARDR